MQSVDPDDDDDDDDDSDEVTISEVTLYEIDMTEGVISEISHSQMRIIMPLLSYGVDIGNISMNNTDDIQPTGTLVWPNFTVQHKDAMDQLNDSEALIFELTAQDVFGNVDMVEFELDDATGWNLSTTTMPMTTDLETTDIFMSTTEDMDTTIIVT